MTSKNVEIKVCLGTGGMAAGAEGVLEAFNRELASAGVHATVGNRCSAGKVGCRGLCAKDVLVDVSVGEDKQTYQFVTAEMVERIVKEHVVGGAPVDEWLVKEDYHNFHKKQVKVVLSDCGVVDPEDIDSYITHDGYVALKKVFAEMSPEKVIDEINLSGLRGRGGAGFPTGRKWDSCRRVKADMKYMICNADEGDPGAFMDRSIIEGNPHVVIEGMIIGAYAVGCSEGYVYIRAEYPLAVERLDKALKDARERNILGKNILGTGFDFDIKIYQGAGAFVCGESTALMRSIEGKRGMPRPTPPNSVYMGLNGKPSVLNNVETFANVPYIIRRGSDWFSHYGTDKSKGTKAFALTGKIVNSGLIEIPMGTTLREIIYDIGGGIANGKQLKAVQTGGPSGGCIPAAYLDTSVDFESLAELGSIVGSGGMIVLDEDDCMVNIAKYFMEFTQEESCGKCVPCRIGTKRLLEIMERIISGKGRQGDIELLQDLGDKVVEASLCGLGKSAPNPILSTIRYYRDEYEAHLNGKCPARQCKAMLTYTVIQDTCIGCGACKRACAAGAITGEKKQPHIIDQSLCIKCGACFDTCKFKSINKE